MEPWCLTADEWLGRFWRAGDCSAAACALHAICTALLQSQAALERNDDESVFHPFL